MRFKLSQPTLLSTAALIALISAVIVSMMAILMIIFLREFGYGITMSWLTLFIVVVGAFVSVSVMFFIVKKRTIVIYN